MNNKFIWFTFLFSSFSAMALGSLGIDLSGEPNFIEINDPNLTTLVSSEPNLANTAVKDDKVEIPVAAPVEPEILKSVETAAAFDPNDPNTFPPVKPDVLPGEEEIKIDGAVTITLANAAELPELKYRLLPAGFDLKDGDAAKLYVKAMNALPENVDSKKLNEWLETEIDELEVTEIEAFVKSFDPTLKLVNEAGCLKECNWDKQKITSEKAKFHNGLKKLTQIIAIKSRIQIIDRDFAGAVETIRSGLAMSSHIADCDNMLQGVLGVSSASIMLEQVEAFVQAKESPCLFRPLQDLPGPLINLKISFIKERNKNQSISSGRDLNWDLMGGYGMGGMPPGMMDDIPGDFEESEIPDMFGEIDPKDPSEKSEPTSHSNSSVVSLMKRLDRMVCALQCVEGIRYYIDAYGHLPKKLSDIRDLRLPVDPVTALPFWYRQIGNKAVLQSPLTESKAENKRIIRYEIQLHKNNK